MQINVEMPDFAKLAASMNEGLAAAAKLAMRETIDPTKQRLRDQVIGVGLGQRLARTWRSEVYPRGDSLSPAGYIWSAAPAIVDSFVRGATIRPVAGGRWLWIPTPNVPPSRRGSRRRSRQARRGAMTPEEVEDTFNTDFTFRRGKGGTLLAYIDVIRSLNVRGGYRANTKGRRAQGRRAEPVLMFVLRRQVRMPKLIDLDAIAREWSNDVEAAFAAQLR